MRIITGRLKGKKFDAPKNFAGRPTTDFAREGFFNIIHHNIDYEKIRFLDLFSGTGAFSYEFYSRGTEDITAVEFNSTAASFIEKNFKTLGMAKATVVKQDVFRFIAQNSRQFDLIFADPPFRHDRIGELPGLIFSRKMLSDRGILVIEHDDGHTFEQTDYFYEKRKYGMVQFSFFRKD